FIGTSLSAFTREKKVIASFGFVCSISSSLILSKVDPSFYFSEIQIQTY
ncbi:hypothetical protein JTE90_007388, partial [Oedothorax gibbosus]